MCLSMSLDTHTTSHTDFCKMFVLEVYLSSLLILLELYSNPLFITHTKYNSCASISSKKTILTALSVHLF